MLFNLPCWTFDATPAASLSRDAAARLQTYRNETVKHTPA